MSVQVGLETEQSIVVLEVLQHPLRRTRGMCGRGVDGDGANGSKLS